MQDKLRTIEVAENGACVGKGCKDSVLVTRLMLGRTTLEIVAHAAVALLLF
jgi:hypothetical protein